MAQSQVIPKSARSLPVRLHPSGSRRKLWTRREFERLVDLGILAASDRLELLDGEIYKKCVSRPVHATGIVLVGQCLRAATPLDYTIRTQLPLALGEFSEPEPDVAVIAGNPREYSRGHPTTAALVVEVSVSTLRLDRITKKAIYATANIPEYWVVNLAARTLEVHRKPVSAADRSDYSETSLFSAEDFVSPLAFPNVSIAVKELLP